MYAAGRSSWFALALAPGAVIGVPCGKNRRQGAGGRAAWRAAFLRCCFLDRW